MKQPICQTKLLSHWGSVPLRTHTKERTSPFFHVPVSQTIQHLPVVGIKRSSLFFIISKKGQKSDPRCSQTNTITLNWSNEVLELLSTVPGPNTPWCPVLICPAQMAN